MRRLLSTEFTVGTFALLGLLIIIYMSLRVNDRGTIGAKSHTYRASFETITGLVRKVPVEVAGIAVGFVEGFELKNNRAVVRIKVNAEIGVHTNAVVTIRDRGILGDRYVSLDPGTADRPLLEDGGEITRAYSKSDFQQIAESLGRTADTIQELIASDEPRGAIGKVVLNLRDMTGRLNDLVGRNDDRISRILVNLESFSKDLNDITGENKEQIHTVLVALGDVADSLRQVLGKEGNINQATERFNKTMASLERIVDKVERGEGTVGKLLNDETTVDKLNETMESVNESLGLFRKIQMNIRYRGEYLMHAKDLQNLVAISLAPAPDKYILFEVVDAPTGRTKVIQTTVSSGGAAISDTKTVQTVDDLVFSLELAKRFWDLTVRFGLMRSRGGIGADYSFFHDKFIVSFEAFDFGRPGNRAHLRTYGTLVLYKHLLLTGGIEDLITKVGSRNPFFGAGIQFNDDDLKALVTMMPRSGL